MRKNVLIFYMGLLFYSCFFVSSVFPAELSEDIEEEETQAEISQEKKSALLEVSVTSTSGNSETASIITGADFFYGASGNSIDFNGNMYYGENSRMLNLRIVEGRVKGAHDFNIHNYGYLLGILKHDEFQRLNLRSSLCMGYGYRFFKDPYEELSFEVGIGLQGEDFAGARKDDYYHEGRIGVNYIYKLSKTAHFITRDEYLPSLSDISNSRIRGEFKLVESLYKNLVIMLNLIVDYDNSPVDSSVKNLDTRLFAGVGYSFF